MKPKICIELQYLPPVSAFCCMAGASAVWIEACEHYQKGSYRNRCEIAGPNGLLRLSVPLLKGKHEGMPIQEVQAAYHENWPRQHWQSIKTAYGSSPFFIHYADDIREVLLSRHEHLWDINLALLRVVFRLLGWHKTLPIVLTDVYSIEAPANAIDCRGLIKPGQSAITLKPYVQVFADKHGFLPNLSILDLLFCLGPSASDYLQAHALQTS